MCTHPPTPRSIHNLHTLPGDVLHEILLSSSDLASLRNLFLTHPTIYQTFNARRRSILRTVFRCESSTNSLTDVDAILISSKFHSIDGVALYEALWPRFEALLPDGDSCDYAIYFLAYYHEADLHDDALAFTRRIAAQLLQKPPKDSQTEMACALGQAAVEGYLAANLAQEALQFQESFLHCLNPRLRDHYLWAEELAKGYRATNRPEKAIQLIRENSELYRTTLGPNNNHTLDCARILVSEYQRLGDYHEAVRFHEQIGDSMDALSPQYIDWSRQHIQMLQKSGQDEEAFSTMHRVWRNLRCGSVRYTAWTTQLIEQYEAAGRSDDAVAASKAAWSTTTAYLNHLPHSKSRRYNAHVTALMLAKVYRRNHRIDDADALEAISRSLHAS